MMVLSSANTITATGQTVTEQVQLAKTLPCGIQGRLLLIFQRTNYYFSSSGIIEKRKSSFGSLMG